jgi:hypothetical protein
MGILRDVVSLIRNTASTNSNVRLSIPYALEEVNEDETMLQQ